MHCYYYVLVNANLWSHSLELSLIKETQQTDKKLGDFCVKKDFNLDDQSVQYMPIPLAN